jgi:hypothetical protein
VCRREGKSCVNRWKEIYIKLKEKSCVSVGEAEGDLYYFIKLFFIWRRTGLSGRNYIKICYSYSFAELFYFGFEL